jgi:hypothetical protein
MFRFIIHQQLLGFWQNVHPMGSRSATRMASEPRRQGHDPMENSAMGNTSPRTMREVEVVIAERR